MLEELVELPVYAAAEIDNCVLGRGNKYDSVKKLSSIMKDYFSDPDNLDPQVESIFYETFDSKEQSRGDLYLKALSIAQKLGKVSDLDKEELKMLRRFCLNLSNQAVRYEDPVEDRGTLI